MSDDITITMLPDDAVLIIGKDKVSVKIPKQNGGNSASSHSIVAVVLFILLKEGNDELYTLIENVMGRIALMDTHQYAECGADEKQQDGK